MEYTAIIYAIVSIVMSFMIVVLNRKSLQKLSWWKQMVLFALLPILVARELIKRL